MGSLNPHAGPSSADAAVFREPGDQRRPTRSRVRHARARTDRRRRCRPPGRAATLRCATTMRRSSAITPTSSHTRRSAMRKRARSLAINPPGTGCREGACQPEPRIQSIGARSATNFHAVATRPGTVLRSSASSIARTSPARDRVLERVLRPRDLGTEVAPRLEREQQLFAAVPSSHAAPSIADSEMRCSVPSMPLPCGNGSAGALHGSTKSRVPKSRPPARELGDDERDRRARRSRRRSRAPSTVVAAPCAVRARRTRPRARPTTANSAAIRNDERNPRSACRGSRRRPPSRVSRSFSSVCGAPLVERHGRIGHLAARRVGDEVAQVERQATPSCAARPTSRAPRPSSRVSPRRAVVSRLVDEHRRDHREREHEAGVARRDARSSRRGCPARRAAPRPARARRRAIPGRTPHAASAAAAHAAVDAGRKPSATSPPASAMPPAATASAAAASPG